MAVSQPAESRRRPWLWATAVTAIVAVVTTGAILADGYDEQEVPRLEPSVWVTRDDGRYARVNTELGEIDTVKMVGDPAGVIQSGSQSVVFTQGYAQAWPVDAAYPLDLVDSSDGEVSAASLLAGPTPTGTVQVRTEGQWVVYRTNAGEVYLGSYPAPGEAMRPPVQLNPYSDLEDAEDEEPPVYLAQAMAIDPAGEVVLFSLDEGAIRTFDIATGTYVGEPFELAGELSQESTYALTVADGMWVLVDTTEGTIWVEGLEDPLSFDFGETPRLQSTASDGEYALVADGEGLVRIDTVNATVSRIAEANGVATTPVFAGGVAYAAWVTTVDATLWDSQSGEVTALETDPAEFEDVQTPNPAIRTNGDRAVLTETVTGSIWTLPDGQLLPSSDWDPQEVPDPESGEVDVEDVVEQEPPVAVDDTFGVRAGSTVSLPLLYNDFDPNRSDVLTIVPSSISDLSDTDFGALSLVNEDQEAVIQVAANEGSATFTYSVTDGYAVSDPATVTLNVIPLDQNSAPEWCGVDSCTQDWPRPQVLPGGFTEVSVLRGWVDPEGDTVVLADARAEDNDAPINVVPTADGKIAIRHLDPNGPADVIPITVTVMDALGAEATRTLELQVTTDPSLEVKPIAVNGAVGAVTRVEIAEHVTGGSGSYRLVDAVASHGDESVEITPLTATGAIELDATTAGRYMATYTVEDTRTLAQSSATLRYTVADEAQPLSIPPLTAFVRPQEDTTVDVLASAQHSNRRVLMVAETTTTQPRLSASVVGTSFVRVSGTTESGEPGLIGVADVTIADGAGNTATTQLSVFLLPPAQGLNPIAMPDTATVRAGSQIDISVLDNDTGPRGERLMLMPEVEGSGAAGELAFGSGKALRYLAPTTPGTYTLRYTTYVESDVERTDSSTVTITVVAAGANQAPEPPTLTARVLLGQAVRIPFSGTGVDPDGDAVTLVDVSQPAPAHGTATISAAGNAIIYRAPLRPVADGQVGFNYTVVDEHGMTASARVRVGVLDSDLSDVAPVTYSDYVHAQIGSVTAIPVEPLRNDSDPLQGELEIVDVRPYASAGTAEYDRLEALFDRAAYEADGTIQLFAGDTPGTHSYVYTVESSVSKSTAEGRIVVDVSEVANPSSLQIQDTVLTARTRHDLASGIDVVSGKVQWQGGDVANLTLSLLPGAPTGLTSSGFFIQGALPDERTVVPFRLSGTGYDGTDAETYGFLRIPALDDMRVQLAPDITPVEVQEDSTVTFNVQDLLDIASADSVEVRDAEPYAVQRDNARCEAAGGVNVSYVAGREAPWSDTCSVALRLSGQETWTVVAVPITIAPLDPQAILSPISRTIRPAESDTVNLIDELVTWEGGRVGDAQALGLTASYSGTEFEVTTTAGVLTATAKANAVPGSRETVHVSATGVDGLTTAITLVVGSAPADAPRGATLRHTCDVSDGARCDITVTGVAGEYDPFAGATGSGLTLVSVGGGDSVSCSVANVTLLSESQVSATWPSGQRPEGGECVVNFTVADAQGRTGQGTLNLDVHGYPRAPSSLTTSSFTGNSVTLEVTLGPAAQAHPNVTGVTILRGGTPISSDCSSPRAGIYRCVVSGLENGVPASYTARAVNAVGESLDTSSHTTWAYQAPEIMSVTAESVYVAGETTTSRGFANVTVQSSSDTRAFRIEGQNNEQARTGASTTFRIPLEPGNRTIRVMPLSQFQPPTEGMSTGSTVETQVTVVGAPSYSSNITASASEGKITIAGGDFNANSASSDNVSHVWYAWREGESTPTCRMNSSGKARVDGGVSSNERTLELDTQVTYNVAGCGSNGYGAVSTNVVQLLNWVEPPAPTVHSGYRINTDHSRDGRQYSYSRPLFNYGPNVQNAPGNLTRVFRYGGNDSTKTTEFSIPTSLSSTPVEVAFCASANLSQCGPWAVVPPRDSSPPIEVQVTLPAAPGVTYDDGTTVSGCFPAGGVGGRSLLEYVSDETTFTEGARSAANFTVDADNTRFVITWSGVAFGGLETISHSYDQCPPPPEPEPEPSPEPTPSPTP